MNWNNSNMVFVLIKSVLTTIFILCVCFVTAGLLNTLKYTSARKIPGSHIKISVLVVLFI